MKLRNTVAVVIFASILTAIYAVDGSKTLWLESPVTVRYYPVTNTAGEVNWGMLDEDWVHNNCTKSNIQIGLRPDGVVIWRIKTIESSE